MIAYALNTSINQMKDRLIPFFPFVVEESSFAVIKIRHEYIRAIMTTVGIIKVAANIISCAITVTVASALDSLPRSLFTSKEHWPLASCCQLQLMASAAYTIFVIGKRKEIRCDYNRGFVLRFQERFAIKFFVISAYSTIDFMWKAYKNLAKPSLSPK